MSKKASRREVNRLLPHKMILFLGFILPISAGVFLASTQTAKAWGGGGWGAAASAMASSGGSGSYGGVSWGGGGGGSRGGGGGGGGGGFGGYTGSGGGYWSGGGWVAGSGGGGPSAADITWMIDNMFGGNTDKAQAWIDGIYKVSTGYTEAWAAKVSSTTPQSDDLAVNTGKLLAGLAEAAGNDKPVNLTGAAATINTDMSQINDYLASLAGTKLSGSSLNLNSEANTKLVIQSVDWSKTSFKLSDSAKQSLLTNKNLSQLILNAKDLSTSSVYTLDTSKISSNLSALLKNAKVDTNNVYVLSATDLAKTNANLQALIGKTTLLTGVGNQLYNLGTGTAVEGPQWQPSLAQQKMGVQGDARYTDGDCMFNGAVSEAWKSTGGTATFALSGLNQQDSQILVAIMKSVAQPQWTPQQLYSGQVNQAEVRSYIDWAKQNQDVQVLAKTSGSGGLVVNLLPKGTLSYENTLSSAGQTTQMSGSYNAVQLSEDLKGYISNNYNNIIGTDGVSCASNIHAWESTQPGSSVYYLKDIMIQTGWGNYISPQNVYDSGSSRANADGTSKAYYLGDAIIRNYNDAMGSAAATVTVASGTTIDTSRQSSYDKSSPAAATIQSILSNNPGMYYKQDQGFFNAGGVKDPTAGQADDVVNAVNRGVAISRDPGQDACDSLIEGFNVIASQPNVANSIAVDLNAIRAASVAQTGTGHLTGSTYTGPATGKTAYTNYNVAGTAHTAGQITNTVGTEYASSNSQAASTGQSSTAAAAPTVTYTAMQTVLQQMATGSTGTINLSGATPQAVKISGTAPAANSGVASSDKSASSETRLVVQSAKSPTSAQVTELLNQVANQLTVGTKAATDSFGKALEQSAQKALTEYSAEITASANSQTDTVNTAAKSSYNTVQLSGSNFGNSIYNNNVQSLVEKTQTLPVNSNTQQIITQTQTATGTGYTYKLSTNAGSATGYTNTPPGYTGTGSGTGYTYTPPTYTGPATGHTYTPPTYTGTGTGTGYTYTPPVYSGNGTGTGYTDKTTGNSGTGTGYTNKTTSNSGAGTGYTASNNGGGNTASANGSSGTGTNTATGGETSTGTGNSNTAQASQTSTATNTVTTTAKILTVTNSTVANQSSLNAVLAASTNNPAQCQYKNESGAMVNFDVTNGFIHNSQVTASGKGNFTYEISCKLNGQNDITANTSATVNIELPTVTQSDINDCIQLTSNDRQNDSERSYLDLPGGDTVYLWQSMESGTRDEFQRTNWYAGYQFTTIKDGKINQLCGNFREGIINKVSLFNGSFTELASVDIVGTGIWKCADIEPVQVSADGRYYVIATLQDAPVNIAYQTGMLPKMVGNVTIEAGLRQIYNLSDRQPIVKYDHIIFGLVDARIDFTAGSDFGPIVTNPAPSGMVFTSTASISVETNGDSTCKFDRENVPYADMRYDLRDAGQKKYRRLLCGLSPGPFTFYVKCSNLADGAINNYATKIRFTTSR